MASKPTQHGLTLLEMAATLAVVAITAAAAAPNLGTLIENRRLAGVATTLAADLQLARNEAIARNQPVRASWQSAQRCYVIHTGSAGQCECRADDAPAVCSGDAEQIRTVRWSDADRLAVQANTASTLFDPLHGTASPTATWKVVAADGRAIHHVVNVMGRVRSCTSSGFAGYRAC